MYSRLWCLGYVHAACGVVSGVQPFCKRRPFGLQKAVFCGAICGLSQCKRPHIADRHETLCLDTLFYRRVGRCRVGHEADVGYAELERLQVVHRRQAVEVVVLKAEYGNVVAAYEVADERA